MMKTFREFLSEKDWFGRGEKGKKKPPSDDMTARFLYKRGKQFRAKKAKNAV